MATYDWWAKTSTPPPGERATTSTANIPEGHEMRNGQLVYTGFPISYDPNDLRRTALLREQRDKSARLQAEMAAIQQLIDTFAGPEYWALRWVLGNDYEAVRRRASRVGQTSSEWAEPKPIGGLPIPAWMSEFITGETGGAIPGQGGREEARAKKTAVASATAGWPEEEPSQWGLAPLSAQAELTQEQMKGLGGLLGWLKAGRPTTGGVGFAQALGTSSADWWTDYVNLSQGMFPSTYKSKAWWRPTKQR